MKQTIITLFDYHAWASNLIFDTAAHLTESEFTAPTNRGSVRSILVHTLSAAWIWRTRCQDGVSPERLLDEAEFPTLSTVRTRWQAENDTLRAYLDLLTDESLTQTITYQTTSGATHQQQLWQLLNHLVLHGMQHHSELAGILTDYGYSPGNIDFIVYLRSI